MAATIKDLYYIVNEAIDIAFVQEKYQLNFYSYLDGEKVKRVDVNAFLQSSVCLSITHQIEELEMYLQGGPSAQDLREAYSWMGKPRARKVKEYLQNILDDADRYEKSKRPGRKKKAATTNK